MDEIRTAMLVALGDPAPPTISLMLRIRHALDTERLWYLRPELMQALGWQHGEARAAAELARITAMFHHHHPT
ncbi:MAG: hypothetical protein HY854_21735 [Burkholderiales bacterium]|nr:hypothetical protein [Burkholderiales bacterium]